MYVFILFLLSSEGGELHFLQIGGVCDDIDDGDMFIDGPLSKGAELLLEGAKPSSNPSSPGITGRTDARHPQSLIHYIRFARKISAFSCLASL